MASEVCIVLHCKSANEPKTKQAVKHIRGQGVKLRVRIPWNKRDKPWCGSCRTTAAPSWGSDVSGSLTT